MESKAKLLDVSKDWKTGKMKLTFLLDKDVAEEVLTSLSGAVLRLKAVIWREKRSLDANAYFHVLCQKIAEKAGASLTEVKNQEIAEYGQIDKEIGCVILKESIDWKKVIYLHLHPTTQTRTLDDGKLYRVYVVMRGSHTYNTKEMSRLIDGTVADAKDLGIETETPEQLEHMKTLWGQKIEKEHHKDK